MKRNKNEKKKDRKEKKKKLSPGRTLENNLFALRAIWKASPLYLFVYLGSSLVYGILGFLTETHLLRKIVNSMRQEEPLGELVTYVVILAILSTVVYVGMTYFWNVVSPILRRRVGAAIERMLFTKARSVELSCYENPAFYDKYVKAMDEAYNRIIQVMQTLDNLISRLIALVANSFLLFVIDPWLILFGLFPLLLGLLRRMESRAFHDWSDARKPIDRRTKYINRTFYLGEYAKEIRIGGMWQSMLRDLRAVYRDYCSLGKTYGRRCVLLGYLRKIGLEVITVLGATLYSVWSAMVLTPANGGMSVGDCIVVLGSIGTISYCLNNLVQNFAEFGEHALFLEDIRYFLDYEPKLRDGEKIAPVGGGSIEVRNLSFRYEGKEENTLQGINFVWHPGERIALVGSNGSGKTTLVKLLLRLYDPTEGEILLNGESIRNFTQTSYRDSFRTVFQDIRLFSLTVAENVLLRPLEEGDRERVVEALKQSGAAERIDGMVQGIDTVLTREFDKKGENLSGGEAQKLSLARVFADKSPFVLLDEPSSALDPIAEYRMFENMMRATENRSVIFISHRLSSAVLADRVLLMDHGTVIESGTHAELMEKNGKYAEMFRRQAENYLGSEVEKDA